MTEYREARARILRVLHRCTGIYGDELSAPKVKEFIADPAGASTQLLGYISGLRLHRFYIAPDKPNKGDRAILWHELMIEFDKEGKENPAGWSPQTNTAQLHAMVEEA